MKLLLVSRGLKDSRCQADEDFLVAVSSSSEASTNKLVIFTEQYVWLLLLCLELVLQCRLQWATKVLRHLVVKFKFRASWRHFTPSLPPPPRQSMLTFLFLTQHRPQRLHNIELGDWGYQRIDARCK